VTRAIDRRLLALELRQQANTRRRTDTTAVYTVYNDGEPRPIVHGPVYRLVMPRNDHA
jgi:hypothetical protein